MTGKTKADRSQPETAAKATEDGYDRFARRAQRVSQLAVIAVVWCVCLGLGWQELRRHTISRSLAGVTPAQVELLGFKIDLERRDTALRDALDTEVQKISRTKAAEPPPAYDPDLTLAAMRRGRSARSALQGARVLWIDSAPDHNAVEQFMLEDLGVHVQRASDPDEAEAILKSAWPFGGNRPDYRIDAIISYVGAPAASKTALQACPVWFHAPLQGWNAPGLSPQALNANLGRGFLSPGYAFAERLAQAECPKGGAPPCKGGRPLGRNGAYLTDRAAPRLVFYSASNGGAAMNACARTVTNRVEVLLNTVISILEESRGLGEVETTLPLTPPPAPPAPAAPAARGGAKVAVKSGPEVIEPRCNTLSPARTLDLLGQFQARSGQVSQDALDQFWKQNGLCGSPAWPQGGPPVTTQGDPR